MQPRNSARLPQERRMEIFRALVEVQDGDVGVAESRQTVAKRFDVTEQDVREIEREGLEGLWPPL